MTCRHSLSSPQRAAIVLELTIVEIKTSIRRHFLLADFPEPQVRPRDWTEELGLEMFLGGITPCGSDFFHGLSHRPHVLKIEGGSTLEALRSLFWAGEPQARDTSVIIKIREPAADVASRKL
jgi:hypothetical protein